MVAVRIPAAAGSATATLLKTATVALLALVTLLALGGAQAQERGARQARADAQFNLVTLSAQAEREVANDTLTAVLAADAEGTDPAVLADSVNRTMRDALKLAQGYPGVKARTLNYQTWPLADKSRIVRWRVRQELRLESRDFAQATELIGKLQSGAHATLQLAGLSVGLSAEVRKQIENALIAEVIAAFHERAEIVREAQKARAYRLKNLQIGNGGYTQPRAYAAPRAALAGVASTAPSVEPGSSSIQIGASGTIQLE